MGVYFSKVPITGAPGPRLNYVPQILNKSTNPLTSKEDWILISDTLIAQGGEQYITIGNFNTDATSDTIYVGGTTSASVKDSYYYIDDVSVIPIIDNPGAGQDTTINCGENIKLGISTDTNLIYEWFPATGLSSNTVAQPIASPTQTTTYYLTVNPNTCKSNLDSVTITVKNCESTVFLPNVFSPNADGVNDEFTIQGFNIKEVNFRIYNRWGEEVVSGDRLAVISNGINLWNGRTTSGIECSNGVYFYYLSGTFNNEEVFTKWGNLTLIR